MSSIYSSESTTIAPLNPVEKEDSSATMSEFDVEQQRSSGPVQLRQSVLQLADTWSQTRKDSPADCCKKGDKGCCRHLCNIFCFPCSYFPRASACCGFAYLTCLFITISYFAAQAFNLDVQLVAQGALYKEQYPDGFPDGEIIVSDKYTEDERQELMQQVGCDLPGVGCTAVKWFPCELYTENVNRFSVNKSTPGKSSRQAECAMVPMPLLYTADGLDAVNETIDLFVKRLRSPRAGHQGASKALWMLQGGPGAPSVAMEGMMEAAFVEESGEMDVYTFDHRGTGRSTPMTCTAAQSLTANSARGTSLSFREVDHCFAAFNAGFSTPNAHVGFSVTNAAHDLRRSIDLFNSAQVTNVYGVSYGTFLVSRYLQITSTSRQATSVILDGVVSTSGGEHTNGRMTFDTWSSGFEQVGKDFFDACSASDFCSGYLGTGDQPYKTAVNLQAKLDDGHCSLLSDIGVTSEQVKSIYGLMLQMSKLRELLPAFVFRLNRCNELDRGFILTILKALQGGENGASLSPDVPADMNELLYNNIKYSEMWNENVTYNTMRQRGKKGHFTRSLLYDYLLAKRYNGFSVTVQDGTVSTVPTDKPYTYPRDDYYNRFPETKSNVLVMNGLLDPQTPFRYGKTQYAGLQVSGGAHKWEANFPGSAHCTVYDSAVETKPKWQKSEGVLGEAGLPCGMQTLLKFITSPNVDPVSSANCVSTMKPISFGQHGAADAAKVLAYPELDMSDLFNGVSDVTQQLVNVESMVQTGVWMGFVIFVLPCCGFFMGFVDLRMKTKNRVCCF